MNSVTSRIPGSALYALTVLAAGGTALLLFSRVGHLAGPAVRVWMWIEFAAGLLLTLLWPRQTFLLAGALALIAPRLPSLAIGADSHNLLLPLFLGLAAGLWLGALWHKSWRTRIRMQPTDVLLWFIFFLVARAWLDYYSYHALVTFPVQDLEIAPGFSANHGFYLSLLLASQLCGPLILIAVSERAAPESLFHRERIARQLLAGFAIGCTVNLAAILLELAGISWLYTGSARSLEAGRPPGLLSDSGISTVALPLLLYFCFEALTPRLRGQLSRRRPRWSGLGPALFLALLFAIGLSQGRAYWISAAAILVWMLAFRLRALRTRRWLSWSIWLAPVGILGLVVFAQVSPALQLIAARLPATLEALAGGPGAALAVMDPPRAALIEAGLEAIGNRPLLGGGLHSFLVETARMRLENPALPPDNPVGLLMGLTGDTGLVGLVIWGLCIFWIYRRASELRRRGAHRSYLLQAALLALAPGLLMGYHIVTADFSALLLLPLAAGRRPGLPTHISSKDRRSGSLLPRYTLAGMGGYVGLWGARYPWERPMAYWRLEYTGRPQFAPDFAWQGRLWFQTAREFAPLADQSELRFMAPTGAVLECPGAEPVRASPVDPADPAPHPQNPFAPEEIYRTWRIQIPEACRQGRYPRYVLQTRQGEWFTLPEAYLKEVRR